MTTAQDSKLSSSCKRTSFCRYICTRMSTIAAAVRIDNTKNNHISARSCTRRPRQKAAVGVCRLPLKRPPSYATTWRTTRA